MKIALSKKPIDIKPIEEFRSSIGFIFMVNLILHSLGWVLIYSVDQETKEEKLVPARTSWRGFSEETQEEEHTKIARYLADNAPGFVNEIETGDESKKPPVKLPEPVSMPFSGHQQYILRHASKYELGYVSYMHVSQFADKKLLYRRVYNILFLKIRGPWRVFTRRLITEKQLSVIVREYIANGGIQELFYIWQKSRL